MAFSLFPASKKLRAIIFITAAASALHTNDVLPDGRVVIIGDRQTAAAEILKDQDKVNLTEQAEYKIQDSVLKAVNIKVSGRVQYEYGGVDFSNVQTHANITEQVYARMEVQLRNAKEDAFKKFRKHLRDEGLNDDQIKKYFGQAGRIAIDVSQAKVTGFGDLSGEDFAEKNNELEKKRATSALQSIVAGAQKALGESCQMNSGNEKPDLTKSLMEEFDVEGVTDFNEKGGVIQKAVKILNEQVPGVQISYPNLLKREREQIKRFNNALRTLKTENKMDVYNAIMQSLNVFRYVDYEFAVTVQYFTETFEIKDIPGPFHKQITPARPEKGYIPPRILAKLQEFHEPKIIKQTRNVRAKKNQGVGKMGPHGLTPGHFYST